MNFLKKVSVTIKNGTIVSNVLLYYQLVEVFSMENFKDQLSNIERCKINKVLFSKNKP